MAISIPTVSTFTNSSVVSTIKTVINWIVNTLVPDVNNEITRIDDRIDTTNTKLNEVITQFNAMVDYVGSDSEIITGTAPTNVTELSE